MTVGAALVVLTLAPLLAGLLSLATHTRQAMEWLQGTLVAVLLVAMGLVVGHVASGNDIVLGHLLRVDALGAFMTLMLAIVGGTGLIYALGYMGEELSRGHLGYRRYRLFFCLLNLYLWAMLLAATIDNIALMWIAVEGSTLAAALLVGFERTKAALEAGWNYIILSFIGIALALFGTVLVYYAAERVLGVNMEALSWSALHRVAPALDPTTLKLAFVFVLIGYGTKAGVAPMHTWLPDAHAQAPTPISAMLSALMLNIALYAVMRLKNIVDQAAGTAFTGPIVIGLGLLSITVAAVFMLIQRDYKRLFAYSSIEHVGIALVGFGIGGPAGVFGGFFHMFNHALAKSSAFYAAGLVLLRHGHRVTERVTGLLKQDPATGGAMLAATIALAGMPPFGLFISEVLIVTAAYQQHPWIAVVFLGLLALAFASLLAQVLPMILGEPLENGQQMGGSTRRFTTSALIVNIVALSSLGFYMPGFLRELFIPMVALFGAEAAVKIP
jgi:hydrogenase-4 component F